MQLHEIAAEFINDTKGSLWPAFAPELVLSATIMVMLLVRACRSGRFIPAAVLTFVGAGLALFMALPSWLQEPGGGLVSHELFTGMLVLDPFTVYLRIFLLVFVLLFTVFTVLSRNPERDDATDFYCLVLGSTIGMCLMASANHLLMVFVAIEMASVPSYALAGQMKHKRKSSEAALKYSIYGAGAAGVMLYGISLVAGVLNTAHLPTIALKLMEVLPSMSSEQTMVLALGGLMIMVGLAFKLSAVPFHFWCPDVFEGASAEVNAFLSVASKAAALALLVRVAIGVSVPSSGADVPATEVTANSPAAIETASQTTLVSDEADLEPVASDQSDPLAPVRNFIGLLVGVIAAVTCTFGNLAAYAQTNVKRLMAYSTIAHAGYMMLAIPAAIEAAGVDATVSQQAIAALALYVAIYLLMNLGAFAVIAFLRNSLGSEEIADYAGLIRRSPIITVAFALLLFSLVGLPPLAGFFGKFAIFAALANSWRVTGHSYLLWLLVIGGLNTAISLFYYLRVVKVMTIDPERDGGPVQVAPVSFLAGTFVIVLTVPVMTLLLYIDTLNRWTQAAARQLF
ncbi:MAG: NADH-quinone oxidoreductase subunit N [Planctomycetaceae bacterium]|nr:NADH-quinone oxidoreductase subunit N [Planctomycetaceae bacterium]